MLKITSAPSSPGVYIMRSRGGEIIYVGKAKNIRKRVASYSPEKQHDPKTSELVGDAESIEYILTDNEVEALILEARLIKEHKPKYNIDLKEGSSYPFIRVTLEEDFPRIFITRDNPRKQSFRDAEMHANEVRGTPKHTVSCESERFFVQKEKGSLYLGPFTDVKSARLAVRIAIELFRVLGERKLSAGEKKLLTETREEYRKRVEKAISFLRGNTKDILKELKEKMQQSSREQNFEAAKLYRNEIASIETLSIRQKIEAERGYDEDYIGFVRAGKTYFVQVFNVRRGLLLGRTRHEVKSADAPKRLLADFLEQYYYEAPVPERVAVIEEPEDAELMEEYLKKISGKNVSLSIPKKAESEMIALILKNISADVGSKFEPALVELQRELGLDSVPLVIECFDVSNIMGSWLVGAMVQFRNGKPDKNNYRRFKIRTVEGQSDVASIREIVLRRYSRLAREQQHLPDLVVIDGGIAQLNSALSAMREAGVSIPAVALAKRLEEIYVPGKRAPLLLGRKSAALKLLQRVRDEAHRFAISYHKLLRRKEYRK